MFMLKPNGTGLFLNLYKQVLCLNVTKVTLCVRIRSAGSQAFACPTEMLMGRRSASATDAKGYLMRLDKARGGHENTLILDNSQCLYNTAVIGGIHCC